MLVQRDVANVLQTYFTPDGMVTRSLEHACAHLEHIMDFTRLRALASLFSMLNQSVRNILNYNHTHPDFPMQLDQLERFVPKALVYGILWSFAGDGKLKGITACRQTRLLLGFTEFRWVILDFTGFYKL